MKRIRLFTLAAAVMLAGTLLAACTGGGGASGQTAGGGVSGQTGNSSGSQQAAAGEQNTPKPTFATSATVTVEPQYAYISTFTSDGVASAQKEKDGNYILIDKNGNQVGDASYPFISKAQPGDVFGYKDDSGNYGLLASDGSVIKEPFASVLQNFDAEGYAVFYNADYLYGIVKNTGEIVLEPTYTFMYRTNIDEIIWYTNAPWDGEGEVPFAADAKFGMLDQNGKVLNEPFANLLGVVDNLSYPYYESDDVLGAGEFDVSTGIGAWQDAKDGKFGTVNTKGEILSQPFTGMIYQVAKDGSAMWVSKEAFTKDKPDLLYSLAKPDGTMIKEDFSHNCGSFSKNGLSWYYPDGFPTAENPNYQIGIIDTAGNVVKEKFSLTARNWSDNAVTWYRAEVGGKYGLVGDRGEIIKEPFAAYASVLNFAKDGDRNVSWYQPEEGGPWGLMDDAGNIVVEPFLQADNNSVATEFNDFGTAWYSPDKDALLRITERLQQPNGALYGIVNDRGKVLMEPFAQKTAAFSAEGVAAFMDKDDAYGVVQLGFEAEK